MTTNIMRSAVVLGFILTISAFNANAQSRLLIKADVPFSFQLKEHTYNAGEYLIEKAAPSANDLTVIVRSNTGESLGIFKMLPAANRGKAADSVPSLIFSRYGDTYVLSEIHAPGEAFLGKVRKTRKETLLQQRYGEPVLAKIKAK